MKTFILFILILISCKSNMHQSESKIITAEINDFGKLPDDAIALSKLTGIKEKYLTSALYVKIDGIRKVIPVNSKKFNHQFFYNYNYTNAIVKITVKTFPNSTTEILIAEKIE